MTLKFICSTFNSVYVVQRRRSKVQKTDNVKYRISCLEEKHAEEASEVDRLAKSAGDSERIRKAKKNKLAIKDKIERLKKTLL